MAAVIIYNDFGAQENKVSVSIVSPSICHEMMGQHGQMKYQQIFGIEV